MTIKGAIILGIFLFGMFCGWKTTSFYYISKENIAITKDLKADFIRAEKYAALLQEYQQKLPMLRSKVQNEKTTIPNCSLSDDGLLTLQSAAGY